MNYPLVKYYFSKPTITHLSLALLNIYFNTNPLCSLEVGIMKLGPYVA